MVGSRTVELLRRVPFLRGLNDEILHGLAASLPMENFAPGEVLFAQGDRPDCLHLLLEGKIGLSHAGLEAEEASLGERHPPDGLGYLEMVYRQARPLTAIALESTSTLRWDRAALSTFLKSHPGALAGFQFLADSERLATREDLSWLRPGEVVYGFARRHTFLLYQRLTVPVLLLIAGTVLALLGSGAANTLGLAGGAAFIVAGGLYGVWQFFDWRNDFFLVTDRRAVWIEKVVGVYDSRHEAPLHTVLSVSVNSDMTGRIFGFGDVVIRTYTGRLSFREVGQPDIIAALIEELWRRLQALKDRADRESLVEALAQRMQPEARADEAGAPAAPTGSEAQAEPVPGMGRWGFQVRFETGGVITYRKHWAVLLREIALPSSGLLFIVGMLGARLGGLIMLFDPLSFLLLGGSAAAGFALWWLYRYVDWANDIYQITAAQILDIYRKPLGREERKVAPIENILGTEVDRKGIVGLLLNYGDVIANVGTSQFFFEGVYDPVQVQQDIVHAQEAFIERRDAQERQRRQNEMVELIDIYHGRFAGQSPDEAPPGSTQPHDDS